MVETTVAADTVMADTTQTGATGSAMGTAATVEDTLILTTDTAVATGSIPTSGMEAIRAGVASETTAVRTSAVQVATACMDKTRGSVGSLRSLSYKMTTVTATMTTARSPSIPHTESGISCQPVPTLTEATENC